MTGKLFDYIVDSIRKTVVGFNLMINGLRGVLATAKVVGQVIVNSIVVNIIKTVALVQGSLSSIAALFNPMVGMAGMFGTASNFLRSMVGAAKELGAALMSGVQSVLNITGTVAKVLGQMIRFEAIAEAIKITFGGIGQFITSMVDGIKSISPVLGQLAGTLKNAAGDRD